MPKVKANNIIINYDQQGTGEPLILIPYLAADYACYAFQVAVLSARMGYLRSPFGGAVCSNLPTPYSGKQCAARIRNSIDQSNPGVRFLSPIRFVRSYSSAVCLTLKPWPNQGGIRSGRRRTGGPSSSAAVTDPPSTL